MKNSEAMTKSCPFMGDIAKYGHPSSGECICKNCMAWENIPKGRDVKEEDKEGYCKRLEK